MSKSRNYRVVVALLGSGHAAVMLADYEDMEWNTDIANTGFGRYATRAEAMSEARDWANDEGVPLILTAEDADPSVIH